MNVKESRTWWSQIFEMLGYMKSQSNFIHEVLYIVTPFSVIKHNFSSNWALSRYSCSYLYLRSCKFQLWISKMRFQYQIIGKEFIWILNPKKYMIAILTLCKIKCLFLAQNNIKWIIFKTSEWHENRQKPLDIQYQKSNANFCDKISNLSIISFNGVNFFHGFSFSFFPFIQGQSTIPIHIIEVEVIFGGQFHS